MITKELLEEWVSVLRSSKYEQGKGRLRNKDKYCCLGVLCDIAKEDIGGSWELANEKYSFVIEDNERSSAYLPYKIDLIEETYLTEMNDKGYSFDEIANYIEENILSEYE